MKKKAHILFQGDSITDAGRAYDQPWSLGGGYAAMTAGIVGAEHPELELQFSNRGISGHRTCDLLARWQKDCIDLEPDILTILIGINNTWRRYDSDDPTTTETFREEYDELLKRTVDTADTVIVLCEPFLLHVSDEVAAWREDLDPKIDVVHEMAEKYGTELVEFDRMFKDVADVPFPAYWASDGVHPSSAGHGLMAKRLAACIGGL